MKIYLTSQTPRTVIKLVEKFGHEIAYKASGSDALIAFVTDQSMIAFTDINLYLTNAFLREIESHVLVLHDERLPLGHQLKQLIADNDGLIIEVAYVDEDELLDNTAFFLETL